MPGPGETAPKAPLVSVVILCYNNEDLLTTVIPSLQQQTFADRMEIIVADNGSKDGSVATARKLGAQVVEVGWNAGFAIANNAGARAAKGKFLFFVNSDMRFEPPCVERLHDVLVGEPWLFAADPLQWNWDGSRVIHGETRLTPAGARSWFPGCRVDFMHQTERTAIVPWGCAGALMVDAEKFRAIGGWDDRFFLDCEDLDMCWRAWSRGWGTRYVPDARLWHLVGGTADAPPVEKRPAGWRHLSLERNFLRFAFKSLPTSRLAPVVFSKLAQSAGWALRGRGRESWNTARAVGTLFREMPALLRERKEIRAKALVPRDELYRTFRGGDVDALAARLRGASGAQTATPAPSPGTLK